MRRIVILAVTFAAMVAPALAGQMTVGFSHIGAESAWRTAETISI